MKCRHCLVEFHDNWSSYTPHGQYDADGHFVLAHTTCAACSRIHVAYYRADQVRVFIYPRAMSREPVDLRVPADFAGDYMEACAVLELSPKASAALSRRCLQHILQDKAMVKAPNLSQEIQKVIDSNTLPSHIAEALDAVRNIGNFAAHSMKSTSSGEVLDVEPGEAEWNLETVEQLFDFYFVGPAKTAEKKAALNLKLKEAGKPLLK